MANDKIVSQSVFEEAIKDILTELVNNTYNFCEYSDTEISDILEITDEEAMQLTKILNDQIISSTKLWSSNKTNTEIQNAIIEANKYSDELIGGLASISLEYVTTLPTTDIKSNVIYILQGTPNTLNVYNESTSSFVSVGNLDFDFSTIYTKSDVDTLLADKADDNTVVHQDDVVSDMTTTSGTTVLSTSGLQTELDKKLDKTSILTAKDDSATDDQVYSAKAINTELDGVIKKNDAFVYKKVSNIDCEEGSWIAQFIEAPTSENGTFPLNDEWQKIEQFKAQDFVHQICTLYTSSGKIKGMYVRFAWCNATKIENAVWSPWQKICTTKVANVPFTKLTLDSSIFTLINSDAGLGYSVCNGMCIITCSGIGLVSVGSHIVTTNIPKPAGGYASNILQPGAGSSVPTTPVFLAVSNNTLTILSNTHTGAFWGTLTYPVAEP